MTIRVLTWNVLYRDAPSRIETLCDRIREVAPDVILLQESSPAHAEVIASALGMTVAAVAPEPDKGVTSVPAIITGLPTRDTVVRELYNMGDRATWAVSATVITPQGDVAVITTHLQHTHLAGRMAVDPQYRQTGASTQASIDEDQLRGSVQRRLLELEILMRTRTDNAAAVATVLGGDFNFLPDGVEYRQIVASGLADTWRAGPRLGSAATILEHNPLCSDGPGAYSELASARMPGLRGDLDYTLDFMFHSPTIQVGDVWIVGRPNGDEAWASDHLGIVADYSLTE